MSVVPLAIAQREVPPQALPRSRVAHALLRLAGWRLEFDGLPARQGVIVVYPHTSNWDFVVGVLAKWAVGVPVVFWGKHTLFELPLFGRWLRWIGGRPVDRGAPGGVVEQMAAHVRDAVRDGAFCWLALAPEGTRSARAGWRSGFHRVAVGAGVPVGLAYLDYRRRRVGVAEYLRLSGDAGADMAAIARAYVGVRGHRPALASPIDLR